MMLGRKRRAKRRTCFYCSCETRRYSDLQGAVPGNARTRDHVFPKRFRTIENGGFLVTACRDCNTSKGERHPLRWLQIMPASGVGRFSRLLLRCGIHPAEVTTATERRHGHTKRHDAGSGTQDQGAPAW
jgi:hypothetical protein